MERKSSKMVKNKASEVIDELLICIPNINEKDLTNFLVKTKPDGDWSPRNSYHFRYAQIKEHATLTAFLAHSEIAIRD